MSDGAFNVTVTCIDARGRAEFSVSKRREYAGDETEDDALGAALAGVIQPVCDELSMNDTVVALRLLSLVSRPVESEPDDPKPPQTADPLDGVADEAWAAEQTAMKAIFAALDAWHVAERKAWEAEDARRRAKEPPPAIPNPSAT